MSAVDLWSTRNLIWTHLETDLFLYFIQIYMENIKIEEGVVSFWSAKSYDSHKQLFLNLPSKWEAINQNLFYLVLWSVLRLKLEQKLPKGNNLFQETHLVKDVYFLVSVHDYSSRSPSLLCCLVVYLRWLLCFPEIFIHFLTELQSSIWVWSIFNFGVQTFHYIDKKIEI